MEQDDSRLQGADDPRTAPILKEMRDANGKAFAEAMVDLQKTQHQKKP